MGYIYRPKAQNRKGEQYESTIWWAKYYVNGKPVRRSTETDKITKARAVLKRWEGDPRLADPGQDKTTIDQLAEDYLDDYRTNRRKSLGAAEDYVDRILAAFHGWRACTITTSEVRQYVKRMQTEGYANATINRDLSALRRMYQLGQDADRVFRRPTIKKLEENNVRQGFTGDVERLAITQHLPFVLAVMAETAFTYGWRKNELQKLEWTQYDRPNGIIRLEPGTTKNKSGRNVVLTASLREKFDRLWEKTRALEQKTGQTISWVFHRNGRPIKDFRGAWAKACEKAGVGKRYFHDYRRTAVRNMEMAGVPRSIAMKVTGHKTESVYKRYTIVDLESMKDATRRIELLHGNGILSFSPALDGENGAARQAVGQIKG